MKMTEEQQQQVLQVRERVIVWLGRACELRAESYAAISHDLADVRSSLHTHLAICMLCSAPMLINGTAEV